MNLVDDLLAGVLDLAIANAPPESTLLTCVQVAELPYYIAMSRREELARYSSVSLEQIGGRRWILFERQLQPPLYDAIIQEATQRGIRPLSIQHETAPEEAFPFVADGSAIAFVVKAGALDRKPRLTGKRCPFVVIASSSPRGPSLLISFTCRKFTIVDR